MDTSIDEMIDQLFFNVYRFKDGYQMDGTRSVIVQQIQYKGRCLVIWYPYDGGIYTWQGTL